MGRVKTMETFLKYKKYGLLICFFGFIWGTSAEAQTVLYESYEQGGEINAVGSTDELIGSFTVPTYMLFNSSADSYVGFIGTTNNTPTGASTLQIYIASSTSGASFPSDSLATYGDVSTTGLVPGESEFYERTITGGNTWLIPGNTYGIYLNSGNVANDVSVDADGSSLIYYGYLSWDGIYDGFSTIAGRTRIVSYQPENATTTASSTPVTLSANLFINEIDYTDDLFLRFRYVRQENLQASVANQDVITTVIDLPITQSGFSTVSTTTDGNLTEGEYLYNISIRTPSTINTILNWFGIGSIYDPTVVLEQQTRFIVGARTQLDQYIYDMASSTSYLLTNPGLYTDIEDNCNPISGFAPLACVTALIFPNQTQISDSFTFLREAVLNKAPVGYITRMIAILGTEATTSLPVLNVDIADGRPLEGEYGWDPNPILATASTILTDDFSTADGVLDTHGEDQNIWDVMMPWLTLIGYLGLMIKIFHDVTGIKKKTSLKDVQLQ